jgi:hypothetical protein
VNFGPALRVLYRDSSHNVAFGGTIAAKEWISTELKEPRLAISPAALVKIVEKAADGQN